MVAIRTQAKSGEATERKQVGDLDSTINPEPNVIKPRTSRAPPVLAGQPSTSLTFSRNDPTRRLVHGIDTGLNARFSLALPTPTQPEFGSPTLERAVILQNQLFEQASSAPNQLASPADSSSSRNQAEHPG